MQEKVIEWVSKKVPTATIAGSILAGTGILANAFVSNQIIKSTPKNCDTVEYTVKGTDVTMKGRNCNISSTPITEKTSFQELQNLTELDFGFEKLFSAGEYSINKNQLLELKSKALIFQLLAQQGQVLYIQGSADIVGDNSFSKSLSNDLCSNPDRNRIQFHALAGESYEKKLSTKKITSPIHNADLPQLRARSVQCWLKSEYPSISTEILEGSVQSNIGNQYRRVRIFTNNKSAISSLTSIPSPD
jgi:hypothetical protein